jgi:hypothetical protein
VQSSGVDFGLADCGGASVTQSIDILNTGTSAFNVQVTVAGAAFSAGAPTVSVPAGGSRSLSLFALVPTSATAAIPVAGAVKLTTDDAAHDTLTLELAVTPRGATLAFDSNSLRSASFTSTTSGATASSIPLVVENVGNAPAEFAFGAVSAPFGVNVTPHASLTLNHGDEATATASFAPASAGVFDDAVSITPTGPVCGASLTSLAFAGRGVAIGAVTGFPSAIDFGLADCGGAAPADEILVLKNPSASDVHVTSASVPGGSPFSVTLPGNDTIAANGGTYALAVHGVAVSASSSIAPITDTLTITTDASGDAPHAIPLSEEPHGAVLSFDTTATPSFGAFGTVTLPSAASQAFSIVNGGNARADITVTAGSAPFSVALPAFTLVGPATQADLATFAPEAAVSASGSLGITASGVVCGGLPSPIALSGLGSM